MSGGVGVAPGERVGFPLVRMESVFPRLGMPIFKDVPIDYVSATNFGFANNVIVHSGSDFTSRAHRGDDVLPLRKFLIRVVSGPVVFLWDDGVIDGLNYAHRPSGIQQGDIPPHPPSFGFQKFGMSESGPHVGARLQFGEPSKIAYLTKYGKNEEYSGDREDTRKYGERIVDSLIKYPRYVVLISVFFGVLCGAIGIAINLNSRGKMGAIFGGALVVVGLLTPVFPWWLVIFLVI